MQDPGETNCQVQPWGKVLLPHQQTHTMVSLSYFADIETPSRWGDAAHKHIDSTPVKPEG